MRLSTSVVWGLSSAAAYLVVGLASRAIASSGTQSVVIWLAAGAIFGMLVVAQHSSWVAICIGGAVASWTWGYLAHGLTVVTALIFSAIEILSIVAGAWFASQGSTEQDPVKAASFFIAGTTISAVLGATLGAALWHWLGIGAEYVIEWRAWAFSTALGILLIAPVLTAFRDFRIRRSGGMSMLQFGAGSITFALFSTVAFIIFHGDTAAHFGPAGPTLSYLPMPLLLISSMLWGAAGGTLATLAGALLVVSLTAAGGGPFSVADAFPGEAVIEVQAYVSVWATLILCARALSEARRRALDHTLEWQLRYERVLSATGLVSVEFDAVTGSALWGESARVLLGPEFASLSHVSEWLARVDPTEQVMAEAAWHAIVSGKQAVTDASYSMRLKSGSARVQVRFAAVLGPDGAVERVAGVLRIVDRGSSPRYHRGSHA